MWLKTVLAWQKWSQSEGEGRERHRDSDKREVEKASEKEREREDRERSETDRDGKKTGSERRGSGHYDDGDEATITTMGK